MLRRWFFFVLLSALALVAFGCGPRWIVVRQASPNPLNGVRSFIVEPVRYDGLIVGGKTEKDYLSGKDADQVTSWETDKAALNERFIGGLLERAQGLSIKPPPPPDAKTFVLRTNVSFIEPGYYAVMARDTEVQVTIQVLASDGQTVIDEITVRSRAPASITTPSSGQRMRTCGGDIGNVLGKYLLIRTGLAS